MSDEKLEKEIPSEIKERYEGSTMSKAGKLAMELAQERKRLQQELSELQAEADDLRPTTPTGTLDWYVKWCAMTLAVLGVFLISAGLSLYGQFFYLFSGIAWIYVGMVWQDRAIMIGSAVTATAVAMNLVQSHF
jgi:hypothetical protein